MTVTAYVNSLLDAFHMCACGVLDHTQFVPLEETIDREYTLDATQQGIVHLLEFCLHQRCQYYDAMNATADAFLDASNSDDDLVDNVNANDDMPQQMDVQQHILEENVQLETDRYQPPEDSILPVHPDPTTWQRYIVIKGAAGTGKTYVTHACVDKCISQGLSVLVAIPTGKLTTEYSANFGSEIAAETIHSAFHFPVSRTERPTINWTLSAYDMIVIDKASMVNIRVADHILRTVHENSIRPILVVCGDHALQQPFEEQQGHSQNVPSMLQHQMIRTSNHVFTLQVQHLCEDHDFLDMLNFLRIWEPSQQQLDGKE